MNKFVRKKIYDLMAEDYLSMVRKEFASTLELK